VTSNETTPLNTTTSEDGSLPAVTIMTGWQMTLRPQNTVHWVRGFIQGSNITGDSTNMHRCVHYVDKEIGGSIVAAVRSFK
jgi:hypothetical protein